jgi:hypothetical protein
MQGLGGVNTPTVSYAVIGDCNVGRPRWVESTSVTERDSIDLRALKPDSESPRLCTLKEADDLRKDIPCKACIEVFDRSACQRLGRPVVIVCI